MFAGFSLDIAKLIPVRYYATSAQGTDGPFATYADAQEAANLNNGYVRSRHENIFQHRPLGVSVATVFLQGSPAPKTFYHRREDGKPALGAMTPEEILEVVVYLSGLESLGYRIVTWNGLQLAFSVLAEEAGDRLFNTVVRLATAHTDILFTILCLRGFTKSMKDVVAGMGLSEPPGLVPGIIAPERWQAGRFDEVSASSSALAKLLCDVAVTTDEIGGLQFAGSRGNTVVQVPMPNGWPTVTEAAAMPIPDTSWMRRPPPTRESFTAWIDELRPSPAQLPLIASWS